jgi:hypothetical protein
MADVTRLAVKSSTIRKARDISAFTADSFADADGAACDDKGRR